MTTRRRYTTTACLTGALLFGALPRAYAEAPGPAAAAAGYVAAQLTEPETPVEDGAEPAVVPVLATGNAPELVETGSVTGDLTIVALGLIGYGVVALGGARLARRRG